MDSLLKPGERIDDLQYKGLRIIQKPGNFCFGTDSVLLANFVLVKRHDRVVDLGCGSGLISILLAGKTQAESITGVEIQEEAADMAQRSVRMNRLEDRVKIINGDLRNITEVMGKGSVEVVAVNPPYRVKGCGEMSLESCKAIARHEIMCTLEDIIRTSSNLLVPGGRLFIVHQPERLIDLACETRKYNLEPKRLRFVHSSCGKPPSLILLEAVKGGRPSLVVEHPLYMHETDGSYTPEAKKIYGLGGEVCHTESSI